MKAVVYHGPGEKSLDEVPDPKMQDDTDAIVRIDTVTICGSDLHILKGDVPEVTPGRILGHEATGTVVERGTGVHRFKEGDRVLLSCISACGSCRFCREGAIRAVPERRRLDLRSPRRRRAGGVTRGSPLPTTRCTRSPRALPTSRCSTCRTFSPRPMRSAF